MKESVIALIITLLLDKIRVYRLCMCLLLIIVKFGIPAVTNAVNNGFGALALNHIQFIQCSSDLTGEVTDGLVSG